MRVLLWLTEAWKRFGPGLGVWLPRVGGMLLVLAAVFAVHDWWWARGFVRADATVTENVSSFATTGGIVYSPKVRFRDRRGKIVQVLMPEAAEDVDFPAGEIVPVLYPASEPQRAMIATVWRVYFWGIVLGVVGTGLFDLGLVLRVMRRRVVAGRL